MRRERPKSELASLLGPRTLLLRDQPAATTLIGECTRRPRRCTRYVAHERPIPRDVAGNWSLMSNVASATTRTTGTLTYECGGGGLIAQQEGPGPEQARQLTLGSFTPHPASQGGSCLLTIPGEMAAAQVEAGVYDLLGRLVRSLRPGGLEPGIRSLAWGLRDEAGRRVVPGLYFVRARIGANELRKSVVVSR